MPVQKKPAKRGHPLKQTAKRDRSHRDRTNERDTRIVNARAAILEEGKAFGAAAQLAKCEEAIKDTRKAAFKEGAEHGANLTADQYVVAIALIVLKCDGESKHALLARMKGQPELHTLCTKIHQAIIDMHFKKDDLEEDWPGAVRSHDNSEGTESVVWPLQQVVR